MTSEIHSEHPFATPAELRDPARRLRGRLASGVTVITTGVLPRAAGLTVSPVLVAEGLPARILALISEELLDDIEVTGRFVVHVLGQEEQALSERFARVRPSPGGLFADLDVLQSDHGPIVQTIGTRAACSVERSLPVGHHTLLIGVVEFDRIDDTDEQRVVPDR